MAKIPPGILAWITLVLVESTVAKAIPEYAAAESKEHIGETARVTGNILGSPAEPGIADVTALVEFTGNGASNKGSWPNGLLLASDGNIYGTTEHGGANNYGTIFKMTRAGALTTLIEFAGRAPTNSSAVPRAGLVEGRDGNFYGTASGGDIGPTGQNNLDNGTVFKLSRSGVFTTLVRFSDNGATNKGCIPYSPLVQAPNDDFYGTTFAGGSGKTVPHPAFRGFGTIYKMSPAGHLATLYDFTAHFGMGQGASPWAGLTLGKDGNFYGSTWGGLGVAGTIFKLTPKGAMTTLVKFSGLKKGGGLVAELVQGSDGDFYGTTPVSDSGNRGTIFRMTPGGALTTLVEFANNDPKGGEPHAPLAEGNDGKLYGTTTAGGAYNWGTIFRVTTGGSFETLWNFNNTSEKRICPRGITGALLKDQDGNFYGATKWGGRDNLGTVFKLTLNNSGTQYSAVPTSNSNATAPATPLAANPKQEQLSKRNSSRSDEETLDVPGLKAAKAEYESSPRDEAARVRYVTKLAGMLGKGMQYWWRTHDKMGGPNLDGVEEELIKHPMPRNVDSRKLTQLLIGKWASPRHVYVFRADGTYGVADEQRDKWRIDRNEYIDDVSRGPIILLDRNYFIYAEGEGVAFYMRANDSEAERNQSANTNTQNAAEEVNSTFNGAGDKADGEEKLFSPDKSYSVEIMRGYGLNSSALVLFNGTQELARIPAEVGPVGSFFEALWSPDGKYVAINKQRSSRPGGDEMWIVALPTGKVLRQPDDASWDEVYEKADAFIAEKGLNETGGKEFLTLIAISWEKDRLRLRLEAGFSETEDRYFFEGTVDPLHLKTIADWKVSKTKS